MANTRQSAKRARQADKKNQRNNLVKATTKSAVKKMVEAVQTKDIEKAKEAYTMAIRALSKAASKGVIPKTRAARKISRLTEMTKKVLPNALPFVNK